jgi:hypothetical protein
MCRGENAHGLRTESVWDREAAVKDVNHGSGRGLSVDPEPDTGMVQVGVEVE